jgi:hypothetical protein
MKHFTLLLICLAAVALFCAGCKGEKKQTPDPNARVTLTQEKVAT